MPTLDEIARVAGKCKATVSLALRNHPRISAAERDRIRSLAAGMGYRPNALVAANMAFVRAGRSAGDYRATLAFLVSQPAAVFRRMRTSFLYEYLVGAKARGEALGYGVDLISLADVAPAFARIPEVLDARSIHGVIVSHLGPYRGRLDLDWSRVAPVAIGQTLVAPEMHRVYNDNYLTVQEALRRIHERGCRRVAFVAMPPHEVVDRYLQRAAFLNYQCDLPVRRRLPLLTEDDVADPARVRAWHRRHQPDCLLAPRATLVRRAWTAAGVRVPDDVGLVTIFGEEDDTAGSVSGFYQDSRLIGATAVEMVITQLQRNERGLPAVAQRVLLPPQWREGATLPPPAGQRV